MIGWVDASSGASGDMLLGALVGAGVPLEVLQDAVTAVSPEPVTLSTELVTRGGFAATRCHVAVADSATRRTWREIRHLVSGLAHDVFERLASAEATVHGTTPEDVHFHEVGALDAIADVVGVCAGIEHLGLTELVVSPIGVGSGSVSTAHGTLPVPPPAVAELLRGVPSYAGPGVGELCTPTGAALLATLASSYGPQPLMAVTGIGLGAGGRDPDTHANVVRLLVGEPAASGGAPVMVETNVDDLDPRLWPNVLQALLDVGASDAWLTPILMKKGRPAHTLHVLVTSDRLPVVRREIFRQTSTIGVREVALAKTALDRESRTVVVAGHDVRVKLAYLDGELLNAQPEYADVALVAEKTGRPVKDVLAEAIAATRKF
ncbi:MAG TPA: nickel pincer cofactor biosynthesis protein LarC [Nocardioidaceae bacterium]|nr:nickel pincer cofactor biosynthesis protein LarC [Nocardioidaceae bacterium]